MYAVHRSRFETHQKLSLARPPLCTARTRVSMSKACPLPVSLVRQYTSIRFLSPVQNPWQPGDWRAEDLVFLSIAFHTIPYACITQPRHQHTAHTKRGPQSADRTSMHGTRKQKPVARRTGHRSSAPCAPGPDGRPIPMTCRLLAGGGSAPSRGTARKHPADPQEPHGRRALTPLPSLDTISYLRKTCLSISSDMVPS